MLFRSALALAQKVIARAGKAGLPADLLPDDIASVSVSADVDAESALRTAVLEFVETVRGAERSIATARRGTDVPEEFDVAPLGAVSEQEWREHWPTDGSRASAAEEIVADVGADEA